MRYRVNEGALEHERLDGEVVVISLDSGNYYSLSGPAADIWTAVDAGVAREALPALLSRVFGADVPAADVDGFLARCVELGLLISDTDTDTDADAGLADAELPADYTRSAYAPPSIGEFNDLQDLILVDPVHESSLLGWPHRATGADG